MSFMKETLDRALPIWDSCVETPFVQEVKSGTLAMEKFKLYMIQDSIYLKHYARVYGKAMYHSMRLEDIQLFYSALCFVTDKESVVRLNYLKQFGLTDNDIEEIAPLPENQNYIDFMLETAEGGGVCEMLMAILPCMLSYGYIFRKIAGESDTRKSKYWDFIADYAGDYYAKECGRWSDFTDEKCGGLPEEERRELIAIFEKASLLELDFWNMAYREENAE